MTIVESIRDIYRRLRSTRFVSNDNVKWFQRSDSEWEAVVDVPPVTVGGSALSTAVFPAKITGIEGSYHVADFYENGIDSPKTGSGNIFVLQINLADTIPVDTWVVANASSIGVTGGGNV